MPVCILQWSATYLFTILFTFPTASALFTNILQTMPCFLFLPFFRHAWNSMHGWPSTHRFGSMMRAYIRDVTLWFIIYFIFWGDSPYPYRMTYCENSIFSLSLDHPFVLVFQTKTSTTTRTVHLPVWLWLRHCWAAPWNGHWRSCSCRGKGAGNNSYPKPLVYTIQIHFKSFKHWTDAFSTATHFVFV